MIDIPGGSRDQYDRVAAEAFPSEGLPQGWLLHVSGPTEDGWRVFNICESEAAFLSFAQERLMPAAQAAGEPTARVSIFPGHQSRPPV